MPEFSRILMLSTAGLLIRTAAAADPPLSFNHDIRPLLSNACFRCHGPDEKERKGGPKSGHGLRLDTAEGATMDLGGRAAVMPGHADASELIRRITSSDPDEVMPPPKSGKPFSPAEVNLIRRWIESGAPFSKHWSYEKPVRPPVPEAGMHPIDAFVRDRLEREGLKPQPEADRATLIRRVTLDLTGLPPSPDEVDAFVKDARPDAWEQLVDRLLAAPAYGEHWARMWLDLGRYADSAGYADDPPRTIWAWRDYVIRAFNANKPFDQFTIEQIAGDLLPNAGDDQVIATAFHRNTMTNSEGGTNDEEFRNAAIVDRVNTTMAVWMGTSMACAQCHTHKYDPITQNEYFRMFAILNNTKDADLRDEAPLHSFLTDAQKAERAALESEMTAVERKFQSPDPKLAAAAAAWAVQVSAPVNWKTLIPSAVKSEAGLKLQSDPDGTVRAAATAPKDTYSVEFPAAAMPAFTGLRIEALPDETLPGHGPGHAGGNFVVTRVRAVIRPPQDAPPPSARYVRIELPGKDKLLQLAEVQVFSNGRNIAPTGAATQVSTFADAGAGRANDGNTAPEYDKGSVAHTGINTDNPWWEVDLKNAQPVERIVVWNRAEAAERLAGFRVVALDANRRPVWEKSGNSAAPESAFTLNGEREIVFADAAADYEQPDFDADTVISDEVPAPKRRKKQRGPQRGWAIGGAPGKPHDLTLLAAAPVSLPAGSTMVLRVEQQSAFASHTIGRFRVSATADPAVERRMEVPSSLAAIVSLPAAGRSTDQQRQLTEYYVRELAPETEADRRHFAELKKKLEGIQPVTVPVYQELPADKRRKTRVQLRGNWQAHGDEVTEGVPAVFNPLPPGPANRLALAKWLVDEQNPLTARVIANRFWESIFGIGIVRTSEEFGTQGELPSHPELLDWLACELVAKKWDMKAFLRLLVTSSTYRQSSRVEPGAAERDPENRLLARGPRVRLSAEMVRDQALAVSGLLSRRMYGPPVRPVRPALGLSAAFGGGLDWQTSGGEDRYRRGLYTEWRRTSPYPSMTTFDAPNREVCTLRRNRTNTPLQALVTLNDPVFVEAAQGLARRLVALKKSPDETIVEAFRLVLSRPPTATESARIRSLADDALAEFRADAAKATNMATNPIGPVPAGGDTAMLAAWTTVSSVLLNLDEALMKK